VLGTEPTMTDSPDSASSASELDSSASRASKRTRNGRGLHPNPSERPVTTTCIPPAVSSRTRDTDRIRGERTRNVTVDGSDACFRTVTTHCSTDPGRIGFVMHRMRVCATSTVQFASESPYPLRPYDTDSRKCGADSGPKFVPWIYSSCPPSGDAPAASSAAGPDSCVIDGRAYDVAGCTDTCPSTRTAHPWPAPAPGAVVHSTTSCACASEHPDARNTGGSCVLDGSRSSAAHSRAASALSDYYTASTAVPAGPKFRPDTCTCSPPGVNRDDTTTVGSAPECAATMGGCYDDMGLLAAAVACPATLTDQCRSFPVPSTVRHSTDVCGSATMHDPATYGVRFHAGPAASHGPYCAFTGVATVNDIPDVVFHPLSAVGPRFVPPSTIVSPPLVDASLAPGPDSASTVGARYIATECALLVDICPPSSMRHSQCAPTPAGTRHDSTLCCFSVGVPAGTAQSVARSFSSAIARPAARSHSVLDNVPAIALDTNELLGTSHTARPDPDSSDDDGKPSPANTTECWPAVSSIAGLGMLGLSGRVTDSIFGSVYRIGVVEGAVATDSAPAMLTMNCRLAP